ncbi:MAG: hypothetical protein PHH58_08470, partial [Rhodoferax sp.]|nr:hypothetical protein [Rhodoferax sp.]
DGAANSPKFDFHGDPAKSWHRPRVWIESLLAFKGAMVYLRRRLIDAGQLTAQKQAGSVG